VFRSSIGFFCTSLFVYLGLIEHICMSLSMQHAATRCNMLQHTATLQHTELEACEEGTHSSLVCLFSYVQVSFDIFACRAHSTKESSALHYKFCTSLFEICQKRPKVSFGMQTCRAHSTKEYCVTLQQSKDSSVSFRVFKCLLTYFISGTHYKRE